MASFKVLVINILKKYFLKMSVFEAKKDFTSEVAILLPESDLICEQRSLDEAITLLFTMEKKCRTQNG